MTFVTKNVVWMNSKLTGGLPGAKPLEGDWPDPWAAYAQRVEALLKPLHIQVGCSQVSDPDFFRGKTVLIWGVRVRAKGSFWDGEFMTGRYVPEQDPFFDTGPLDQDTDKAARQILWDIHRKLLEPPPPADECDWRDNQSIPEDFYSA